MTPGDDMAPAGGGSGQPVEPRPVEPQPMEPRPVDTAAALPPRRLLRGARRLERLVGRRLLVGITLCDEDGRPLHREQFCGTVRQVDAGLVIVDRDDTGGEEPVVLPADEDAYAPAAPGTYVLTDTGEHVIDPDFLTTWEVRRHPDPPR